MHRFVKQGIKSARNMVIAEPKPNPFSNKLLVLSHNYSVLEGLSTDSHIFKPLKNSRYQSKYHQEEKQNPCEENCNLTGYILNLFFTYNRFESHKSQGYWRFT